MVPTFDSLKVIVRGESLRLFANPFCLKRRNNEAVRLISKETRNPIPANLHLPCWRRWNIDQMGMARRGRSGSTRLLSENPA